MLLKTYFRDVDLFDIPIVDSIKQLCWEMKKVIGSLKGKVVEIGIDATCAYQLCFYKQGVSTE